MENAIAPNAFNYKEIVGNLKSLKAAAHQVGVPVIYSQQVPFDLEREEAGPWVLSDRMSGIFFPASSNMTAPPDIELKPGRRIK